MHRIANDPGALVPVEAEASAQPVADRAADYQPDAGASPDITDALGAALEDQLSEQAEENLGRASTAGPTDADQRDAEDQRRGAHIAQAFHVLVPGADYVVFGQGFSGRAETSLGHAKLRNRRC